MQKLCFFILGSFILFSCSNENDSKPEKTPVNKVADSTKAIKLERPTINPYVSVDVSPMDMSYYPVDYPIQKMTKKITTPPLARVIYSRPHLQGRHIFHEVLKYEQPWRLGANEATELELYTNAEIAGKKINKGRYILYCIPHPEEWTIVLNNNIDSWGLEADPSKDILQFNVPVTTTNNTLEYFTMVFEKKNETINLLMAWDNTEVRVPFRF